MRRLLILLSLLFSFIGHSQNYSYKKKQITQKGSMYALWGYNRSIYTKSNINFAGPNYNFTILNAKAKDNPARPLKTYINPKTLTVPQFNFRFGYYTNTSWDLSLGWDHMKYVMVNGQEAKLTGYVDPSVNQVINGEFDNEIYPITDEFIHYENSNGLNYVSFQAIYNKLLFRTESRAFAVRARLGGGIGPVVTQTDFNFNNQGFHTKQKLTGFGASIHSGIRLEFLNRFFFLSNWSAGAISLPHLQTIKDTQNFANQKFVYADWQLVGGVFWFLKFKNGCNSCPDWH